MDTSRDDVGISIRSAFLRKGTQQRFSLFILMKRIVLVILVLINLYIFGTVLLYQNL